MTTLSKMKLSMFTIILKEIETNKTFTGLTAKRPLSSPCRVVASPSVLAVQALAASFFFGVKDEAKRVAPELRSFQKSTLANQNIVAGSVGTKSRIFCASKLRSH